jgi:hypothetical protein
MKNGMIANDKRSENPSQAEVVSKEILTKEAIMRDSRDSHRKE